MNKQMINNPHEHNIIANAKGYFPWHRMVRKQARVLVTEEEARAQAETLVAAHGGRAILYAVGDVCGVESQATVASLTNKGWEEAV